jgi:thioredoxin 2
MATSTETARVTVSCPSCSKLNRVKLSRLGDQPKCGSCGKAIRLDQPIALSDRDFERVVTGSEVPLLVDFYADWCGPCKVMAPHIEELARKHAGRALIAKLDTDRNQTTAQRFAIRGIPTLIVFRDGREVAREVGAVPKPRLEELLERQL